MARGGGGYGDATRARHSMAVSPCGWLAARGEGGGQKFRAAPGVGPLSLSSAGFFLVLRISERLAQTGGQRDASRAAGGFARPNAAPPRLHGLASTSRALSRAVFAIMRRGRIFGGLFSHLPNSFREALFYKGTMGTWEQAMSNRQKAEPLEGASLFPSHRAALGTREQKWPIPMQENPRACGIPVPPPAADWG